MRRVAPLVALTLAGCTVGPNFTTPRIDAPSRYGAEPQDIASRTYGGAVDTRWRRSFGDPELSSLVDRLARQNLDLQSAGERIRQAQAEVQGTQTAQGLPALRNQQAAIVNEIGLLLAEPPRAFMFGPTIDIPFFQGGQLKGTLELRKSQQRGRDRLSPDGAAGVARCRQCADRLCRDAARSRRCRRHGRC